MDNFKALLRRLCDRELVLILLISALVGCLVIQIRDKEAALIAFHTEETSHLDSLKKESERRWEMAGFYTDQLQKEKELTHAANERHGETLDRLREGVAKELSVKELVKFVMAP